MSSFNEANVLEVAQKLTVATENVKKVFDSGRIVGIGEGYDSGHSDGYRAGHSDGVAQGLEDGYHDGYVAGKNDGYEEGHTDGKKAEYDAFWDVYMPANLANWQYIFYSQRWNDANFYPKRDIKPTGAAPFAFSSNSIRNFKQKLIDCNISFDTSKVTSCNYLFAFCSHLTNLPIISLVGLTSQIVEVFATDKKLVEIEKIILKDDGSTTFSTWFRECESLTDIAFEGVIGQDIDFKWSTKLSRASIESIIDHLSDTASGKTLTLSRDAVDEAFKLIWDEVDENGEHLFSVGSETIDWRDLEREKPNWTINLV